MRIRSLAAALAALAISASAHAIEMVQWSSATSGTLGPATVTLAGNGIDDLYTGGFVPVVFSAPHFTAPVSLEQAVSLIAPSPFCCYTQFVLSFSTPVQGLRLHLASLASELVFDATPTKLSGQDSFVVSGNTVTGAGLDGPTPNDANGTIEFAGTISTLTITFARSVVASPDNLFIQVAAQPVPEPASWLLMLAGASALGAGAARRRRSAAG